MRLLLRAGVVVGLAAMVACGKDAPSPVDFNDPAAVSANLSSVDSAFDSDVFRSFSTASVMLDVATAPAFRPTATLIETLRPKLVQSGARIFLPAMRQAQKLQAMVPNLSVSAAQGRIIPDTMYGRVFEWDTALNQYRYQGTTVANLTGVRFVLYATGLDGQVVEPVSAIGTLDIIDQSTPTKLQAQVLVKGPGGTTTYVDYTASVTTSFTSASASVSGTITNGLSGGTNKTLSFDETLSVNASGASVHATFSLNNPAITLMLNESVTFNDPNIIIGADFRLIQNGETIRAVGHITINNLSGAVTVSVTVSVDGHPVASISGDPTDPATHWVDAGGEPLTVADLQALADLFDAFENFGNTVSNLFAPVGTFAGL
ncbi:MAG: hypothetical protein DMD40_08155 [Gemmatimonadetes bacterium]|nr:MAG: hypothetical protein DMD40_08155 [Gemmatimonadota bacterium]